MLLRERAPHSKQQQHTARRQQGPSIDSLLKDEQPLDAQEQEAVIAALEAEQLSSTRLFRRLFAGIALTLGAFFLYAAASQALHPWEARYTGELRTITAAGSVAAVLLLQGVAQCAAGCALLLQLPRPAAEERRRGAACVLASPQQARLVLRGAVAAAGVAAAYWGAALHRSVAKYGHRLGAKWELWWLPLGPLGYCLLCCYVLASFSDSARELEQLRELAYDFKKV